MLAKVIGKYNVADEQFLAAVVYLQPEQVSGVLESITPADGGDVLAITPESGPEVEVFMPARVKPFIEGGGIIPDDLFACTPGSGIRVVLDPERPVDFAALEVRIQSAKIEVTAPEVVAWTPAGSTVKALEGGDEAFIFAPPSAAVLQYQDVDGDAGFTPIGLHSLVEEDRLTCFVLETCGEMNDDYHAFVILVNQPEAPAE